MATSPSTTPGFCMIPPTSTFSECEGSVTAQPPRVPNMPTALTTTVPRSFFEIGGHLIHRPDHRAADRARNPHKLPDVRRRVAARLRGLHAADFVVDFLERLVVGGAHDVAHGRLAAIGFDLDHRRHVHVVEDHEPPAPVANGVNVFVFVHRARHAGHEERGEGQPHTARRLVRTNARSRLSHVDFQQADDRIALFGDPADVGDELAHKGQTFDREVGGGHEVILPLN